MATQQRFDDAWSDLRTTGASFHQLRDASGWYRPESGWTMLPDPSLFTHSVGINRTDRIIGHFASTRMGISVPFHSSLEHDWLQLIDVAPEVDRFHVQPPTLAYRLAGETRHYTADALVILDGAPTMVEVKYEEDATRSENLARWPAIRDQFAEHGFGFKVVTERFIRAEPRLSNVQYLQLFRGWQPDAEFAFAVALALQGGRRIPLGELAAGFDRPLHAQQFLLGLVLRRYLRLDLDVPISANCSIWLSPGSPG